MSKVDYLLYTLRVTLLIASVCELGEFANRGPLIIEDVWYRAASESDKSKKSARPLITKSMIHLDCEQHDASAPYAPQEGLGSEC